MGLDLAFGKGDRAAGGILLRSLIPSYVSQGKGGEKFARNSELKADFIEGPCNCVKKILEITKPSNCKDFSIADLVKQGDFSLDAFN